MTAKGASEWFTPFGHGKKAYEGTPRVLEAGTLQTLPVPKLELGHEIKNEIECEFSLAVC